MELVTSGEILGFPSNGMGKRKVEVFGGQGPLLQTTTVEAASFLWDKIFPEQSTLPPTYQVLQRSVEDMTFPDSCLATQSNFSLLGIIVISVV